MFGHEFSAHPAGLWVPLQPHSPGEFKEDLSLNTVKDAAQAADPKGKKKPTDTDHELEGLMSEIETDLREEELKKIWKNYGGVIIAFVVAVVVGVAGFQFYRQAEATQRDQAARNYEAAIKTQEGGNTDEALKQFAALANEAPTGYATMARLAQASLQLQKNDIDGALANYKTLAADTKADPVFRDLATLLGVLHGLDREDPKTLEAQLTPLTSPTNAFNHSALELTALLAAKQGDAARAVKTLAQLTADPQTPVSMRQRAEDLTKLYESGALPPPPAAPQMPATPAATTPTPDAAPAAGAVSAPKP